MTMPVKVFIWCFALCFPLLGLKVTPGAESLEIEWLRPLALSAGISFLYWTKKYVFKSLSYVNPRLIFTNLFSQFSYSKHLLWIFGLLIIAILPLGLNSYHNTILTTTMMYLVLALGLNIVVGLAGLLDLGYVAFYAVGAYTYGLLSHHIQLSFWFALPVAGFLACIAGILLGIPVLRLRGDYLAIVTLGFGEIIRLVLENWDEVTFGPQGIVNIGRPALFGFDFNFQEMSVWLFYLMLILSLLTILVVRRLGDSSLGRAWKALREDELACESMGINTTNLKLYAFGSGACWAGMTGAFFAAKNSFVNPSSFTFLQSALILCIVILGGGGSILGIIIATLLLILTPEYFRFFEQYRMLIFGLTMVAMMILRPGGIIEKSIKIYSKSLK